MLFNLGNDEQLEREAIRSLSAYRVEGFILHTLGHDAGALADAAQLGKPVVLVDRKVGDAEVDLVALDNLTAVQEAAGHLAEAGYRHLLFISEPIKAISSRNERARAFQAFVAEHSDTVGGTIFEAQRGDDDALDEALRALRRGAGQAPVAVLAANAVISLRVAASAARLGWQLGADLGLIGFDDPEWAALVGPGLSAISQPTDDIGRVATNCLIERLQARNCRRAGCCCLAPWSRADPPAAPDCRALLHRHPPCPPDPRLHPLRTSSGCLTCLLPHPPNAVFARKGFHCWISETGFL